MRHDPIMAVQHLMRCPDFAARDEELSDSEDGAGAGDSGQGTSQKASYDARQPTGVNVAGQSVSSAGAKPAAVSESGPDKPTKAQGVCGNGGSFTKDATRCYFDAAIARATVAELGPVVAILRQLWQALDPKLQRMAEAS